MSKEMTYEEAYDRLEKILEHLNNEEVSLEESLKLYEEADKLITSCSKKLNEAEQKIQILIKNRNGELEIGSNEKPLTEEFAANQNQLFNQ